MTRHTRAPRWVLAALLLVALGTAWHRSRPAHEAPVVPDAPSTAASSAAASRSGSAALALLATLRVKGRAPKTGYRRDQFGPAWFDVDHNGCRTRDDVLTRDLTDRTYRDACVVLSGVLVDPYTHATIVFRKAQAAEVQIDHVVALSDAWQTGAQQWTAAQRLEFANDPLELLAVGGAVNDAKSDSDAASWLPPYKPFRCAFVTRQVQIKAKWRLWVTAAEHDAIARVLAGC